MLKLIVATCMTAASLAAASGAAAAGSADPVPGAANCHGHLVAVANHSSGADGASGNAGASAGPGYFMHSSTHDGIVEYVGEVCG